MADSERGSLRGRFVVHGANLMRRARAVLLSPPNARAGLELVGMRTQGVK